MVNNELYENWVEQGIEQERAKSEAEKLEIAKNFLAAGLTPEEVAKGTGLDLDIILKL